MDNFEFKVPDSTDRNDFIDYIESMPRNNIAQSLGLEANSGQEIRKEEANEFVRKILLTKTREADLFKDAKVREEIVKNKCMAFKSGINFEYKDYLEKIAKIPGPKGYEKIEPDNLLVPLNIFLAQEIFGMQKILAFIHQRLDKIIDSIDGKILTDANT